MRDHTSTARNSEDCLIFAAPCTQDLATARTAIEGMQISLQVVRNLKELREAASWGREVLGIIIAREFLGEDVVKALAEIKRIAPLFPIVLAASKTSSAFERSVRRIGIFYYLLSPFDRDEFLSLVYALYSYRTRREMALDE